MAEAAATYRVVRVRPWHRDPLVRIVEIEGAGSFRLDAEAVEALGVVEGGGVSGAIAERLAQIGARWQGRAVALRLLERRLRSRAELEGALRRRGLPKVIVAAVLADLARAGFIDDARFAQAWVRDRLALRPSGRARLRAELLARGVAPEVAAEAIGTLLPSDKEEDLALAQARLRMRRLGHLPSTVTRRRLVGWLQRRGFGAAVIARALRRLEGGRVDTEDVDATA
ncbi:MAG: RecX family transcriptional regulator [Armatimonadetes bacterium]|nr:RecX family transcriptional regulator [Armatimonadota bacterium]